MSKMLPAALHASVACVLIVKYNCVKYRHTHTHISTSHCRLVWAVARGQCMGSVNSRRPDKMTCVRPRGWHSNCVCVRVCVFLCVCVCVCIWWWCLSVVCTAPTLLFTMGDFRRIVGSWQAPSVCLFFPP